MATTTSENINDAETLPELDVIWKIVSPGELDVWQSSNAFTLESELDQSDGFFHCSNTLRIRKTADLYFKTISNHKMVKIETKTLTHGNTRSVIFTAEAPTKEEVDENKDSIFSHYLLVEGKACCAHVFANFEKYPLKTEDVISGVFDMPWVASEGKHEFPGLDMLC